jgi:hypothetical protein
MIAEPFGPPKPAEWFMRAGRVHRGALATVHIAAYVREMMAIELVTPAYMAKLADTLLRSLEDDPQLVDQQTMVVPGNETVAWFSK